VTIESVETGAENGEALVKLVFSNGSHLSLKLCYLSLFQNSVSLEQPHLGDYCGDPASWGKGRELSVSEEETLRFAASCYKAERIGMRLVARAEQNSAGLEAKLGSRGFSRPQIQAVVSRFLEMDLLNDRRYAKLWLQSRLARRNGPAPGPRRLMAKLRNRGIANADISAAFDDVLTGEAEWALLMRFLEKNRIFAGDDGRSLRSRLRFEGFSASILERFFDGND
jgi:regulatory protein